MIRSIRWNACAGGAATLGCLLVTLACSSEVTVLGAGGGSSGGDAAELADVMEVIQGGDGACDLSGIWATEVQTFSAAFGQRAVATNWYYFEIQDNGDEFVVTRGVDCQFQVACAAVVNLSEATAKTLISYSDPGLLSEMGVAANANSEVGRGGVFREADGGGCEFSLDRWYKIRGADPATYLAEPETYEGLELNDPSLPPLPDQDNPEGNEDWEGDLNPGISLITSVPVNAQRFVVQRDWTEVEMTMVPEDANDFTVPLQFDNQEGIVAATNPILIIPSIPECEGHSMRWIRISDPMPQGDIDEMFTFCREEMQARFDVPGRSFPCEGEIDTSSCRGGQ